MRGTRTHGVDVTIGLSVGRDDPVTLRPLDDGQIVLTIGDSLEAIITDSHLPALAEQIDSILAPVGSRFALAGSTAQDGGARPWGLRHTVTAKPGSPLSWAYDPARQIAVDPSGAPLTAGDPTAVSTASVDGEDPPSSEDWIND